MLDSLRNLVSELTGGIKHPARFEEDDYRLAAAALLIQASAIDGNMTASERGKLHDLVKSRFALDEAATRELIHAATLAEHEAVDLYRFTSLLNRLLDDQAAFAALVGKLLRDLELVVGEPDAPAEPDQGDDGEGDEAEGGDQGDEDEPDEGAGRGERGQ